MHIDDMVKDVGQRLEWPNVFNQKATDDTGQGVRKKVVMPEHPNLASQQPHSQKPRYEFLQVLLESNPYHQQQSTSSQDSNIFYFDDSSYQSPPWTKENIQELDSDSGGRADDENIYKKLSASKQRHLQLLAQNNTSLKSQSDLTQFSDISRTEGRRVPQCLRETGRRWDALKRVNPLKENHTISNYWMLEYIRSGTEAVILLIICGILCTDAKVRRLIIIWKRVLICQLLIISSLLVLHLFRRLSSRKPRHTRQRSIFLAFSASTEIAPLLYPSLIPILVSLILFRNQPVLLLPTLTLGITSIPEDFIPQINGLEDFYIPHWMLSLLPIFLTKRSTKYDVLVTDTYSSNNEVNHEFLVFLHPLHHSLFAALKSLTTSSLLPAELQLLSTALIHLLLHAKSPQAVILKSLLWGGGIGVSLSCSYVLKWGLAISRVPKWRFRREEEGLKFSRGKNLKRVQDRFSIKTATSAPAKDDTILNSGDEGKNTGINIPDNHLFGTSHPTENEENPEISPKIVVNGQKSKEFQRTSTADEITPFKKIQAQAKIDIRVKSLKRTPSGRRKRAVSSCEQSLSTLTLAQASARKFLFVIYVYISIFITIFVGIRSYVKNFALSGSEPIGWALGYLFGDLSGLRNCVVTRNLQQWIPLPSKIGLQHKQTHDGSWIEQSRQTSFGEANTRLFICGYWLMIIIIGLVFVQRISSICQVDTRRKVFHIMMVAMLLPVTYIDPIFAAFAQSLMLAIFLLLDIFRATRLPPLSKPLAYFLAPFVDARDLKGPIVISHTFLLIGCAIPLWLSLGTLRKTGSGPFTGWDVTLREVSMVSGVICVGIGDAAASLIGRRYGHHKWVWGGTKSIEGSAAFAVAVGIALLVAKVWLEIGGWQANNHDAWYLTLGKACIAACIASLSEAVITGVNDNVIVPIVLWLCVKGLDV